MATVPNKPFDLSTWDGFSELSKDGLDYLLDTTALNKKLKDRRESPYRWRTGCFSVPITLKGESLHKTCKSSIDRWLSAFEKQGWVLASKVQVYPGKKYAYDVRDNIPLLDKTEILCRAIFKTTPRPVRIELPPSSVRQDPEQKATLKEVMRGEGITAVPLRKRMQGGGLRPVPILTR